MSSSFDVLMRPFESEKLTLKNRIAMAPMTRLKSPNGIPTEEVAAYYERRAANDVGLVITEGTNPNHPAADMSPDIPAFHGEALNKWEEIVTRVHAAGALTVGLQGRAMAEIGLMKTTEQLASMEMIGVA